MNAVFVTLISSFLFLSTNGQLNPLLRWKLENPATAYIPESNKFSLIYNVHESINDENIKAKIFTSTCQNPDDGSKGVEVSDGITIEKIGASDGLASLEFVLDIPKLTRNKEIFDVNDPEKPEIKLCARFMLWTPANEVNFIESLLTVKFDMKNEMEISFSEFDSKAFDSSGNMLS